MNKNEFLAYLRTKLKRFPQSEIDDAVAFYDELLCDKIENENLSETDAVASLGSPDTVAVNCASEMLSKNTRNNPFAAAMLLLGILASPVLLPLAIVVGVLYIVVFVVWISLVASFGAASLSGVMCAFAALFSGNGFAFALTYLGIGLMLFAVFALLCLVTYIYGAKFINLITVRLAKAIFKRS